MSPRVEVSSMAGQQGRVDLTPSAYNLLIEQKGYRARWEKATFCPHRSPQNALEHDITHYDCDSGWVFYDPQTIKVLMTGFQKNQQFKEPGRVEPGTVYATTNATYRLGFWDKITLLDSTMRFMELQRRQPGMTDRTKYDLVDVLDIRDSSRTYARDTDYQIINNRVTWLSTGASPAGSSIYAISYTFRPVYLVMDLMHDIRDSFVIQKGSFPPTARDDEYSKLPVQALCRLQFLVQDPGQLTTPTLDNQNIASLEPTLESISMSEST